jgi:hypothetical protein
MITESLLDGGNSGRDRGTCFMETFRERDARAAGGCLPGRRGRHCDYDIHLPSASVRWIVDCRLYRSAPSVGALVVLVGRSRRQYGAGTTAVQRQRTFRDPRWNWRRRW